MRRVGRRQKQIGRPAPGAAEIPQPRGPQRFGGQQRGQGRGKDGKAQQRLAGKANAGRGSRGLVAGAGAALQRRAISFSSPKAWRSQFQHPHLLEPHLRSPSAPLPAPDNRRSRADARAAPLDQAEHGVEPVILLQDLAHSCATGTSRSGSKSRNTGRVRMRRPMASQFGIAHGAVRGGDDDHDVDEGGVMADRGHADKSWMSFGVAGCGALPRPASVCNPAWSPEIAGKPADLATLGGLTPPGKTGQSLRVRHGPAQGNYTGVSGNGDSQETGQLAPPHPGRPRRADAHALSGDRRGPVPDLRLCL